VYLSLSRIINVKSINPYADHVPKNGHIKVTDNLIINLKLTQWEILKLKKPQTESITLTW
jgi:hypothetical protein